MNNNLAHKYFWTTIRVLIVLIAVVYIVNSFYKQRDLAVKGETVLSEFKGDIKDKTTLKTLINSSHYYKDGRLQIALLKTPDTSKELVPETLKVFEKAVAANEYFCFEYKDQKKAFPASEKARDILQKHQKEIIDFMKDEQYKEANGKFGLPKNIVIGKNTAGLTLSESEYNNFFGKEISRAELPKILVSKTPFEVGKGTLYDTTFPQIAHALTSVVDFTKERNSKMSEEKEGQHILYTVKKKKKVGNGLSIPEFNEKQYTALKEIFSKPNVTLRDINIVTEDLTLKRTSQSAQGYYNSIDEYLSSLEETAKQKNIQYNIQYIDGYKNRLIVETDKEYIGLFFDDTQLFYKDFKEKEKLASFNNQNYTLGTIYYFIDPNIFLIKPVSEEEARKCDYYVRNNLIIDNRTNTTSFSDEKENLTIKE